MVTSGALVPYTIATAPLAGTEEMRPFSWPGAFGFGARPSTPQPSREFVV